MYPKLADPDCYTHTDYEVGKRLFNMYNILQILGSLPKGRTDDSISKADELVQSMNYDFAAAVTALKDQGLDLPRTDLVGDETHEVILYKFMGYLRLSESSRDQFILLMNRLPRVQIPDSKKDTQTLPTVDQYFGLQDKAPAAVGSVASGSISETDPDNWKYTSLLWEKGQLQNTTPVCTETCLSNFPTRFRVTIQFKGVQGSGDARNKRLAKHIAARAVCQTLGFRPS